VGGLPPPEQPGVRTEIMGAIPEEMDGGDLRSRCGIQLNDDLGGVKTPSARAKWRFSTTPKCRQFPIDWQKGR
jgi:hypothetical protein